MKFNSLQKDPHHHHHGIGYNVDNNKLVNQNSDNSSIINTCNNNNNHNSNHNVNNHTSSSSTTTMTTNAIKMVNYHKSCDTIDQQSGLKNYYSLHSLLSYVAENRNAISSSSSSNKNNNNNKNKSYKLHAKTATKAKRKSITNNQNRHAQHYKYNTNYLASLHYQRQMYLAIRFSMKKSHHHHHQNKRKNVRNSKFILVKNLPYVRNYYHLDDSIDDPLRKFLQDHLDLRNHLYTLFRNQTKKLLYIKDDSDLPTCILLNNLLESFKFDFKRYNFNLNIDDYYSNFNNQQQQQQQSLMAKKWTNLSIQEHILVSYINSFELI